MDDRALTDHDDLLLRLMDRYKPHLKPYAYRLQTWEQVLEEYNSQTGSKYRQIRTLKKKFEKLRDAYTAGDDKIEVGNLELLQKLLRESHQQTSARSQSQMTKIHHSTEGEIIAGNLKIAKSRDSHLISQRQDNLKENLLENEKNASPSNDTSRESSGPNQPPPLDSITIGFPHSHGHPHNDSKASETSSPSQIPIASSSYDRGLGLTDNHLDPINNVANIEAAKTNTPSTKGSPEDEHVNAQMNTRVLSNLLSQFATQHQYSKSVASSQSSPFPISNMPINSQASSLTLEVLYAELQNIRVSQEELRNEVLYRLDIISAGLAENLNQIRQQGKSQVVKASVSTDNQFHIDSHNHRHGNRLRNDSDDDRERSLG